MSRPRSPGRMIRKDISKSKKIALLSPKALSLFVLLIPHYDSHGKMNGDPRFIKGDIAPLIPWLKEKTIRNCLEEIHSKTNVKWFESEGRLYLHSLSWSEHQDLRKDRIGKDFLPNYPGQLRENSQTTPGLLPREVEGEVKEKEEDEVKGSTAASAGGYGAPASAADPTDLIPKEIAEQISELQLDVLGHALSQHRQGKMTLEEARHHLMSATFDNSFVKKVEHLFQGNPPEIYSIMSAQGE